MSGSNVIVLMSDEHTRSVMEFSVADRSAYAQLARGHFPVPVLAS